MLNLLSNSAMVDANMAEMYIDPALVRVWLNLRELNEFGLILSDLG